MHEFIAALRQLRRPLVMLAVGDSVVADAGGGGGERTCRRAGSPPSAPTRVICHGNGEDGSTPAGTAAHECCVFCTNAGPVALSADAPVVDRLDARAPRRAGRLPADVRPQRRAIRAGPSQAPPTAA